MSGLVKRITLKCKNKVFSAHCSPRVVCERQFPQYFFRLNLLLRAGLLVAAVWILLSVTSHKNTNTRRAPPESANKDFQVLNIT